MPCLSLYAKMPYVVTQQHESLSVNHKVVALFPLKLAAGTPSLPPSLPHQENTQGSTSLLIRRIRWLRCFLGTDSRGSLPPSFPPPLPPLRVETLLSLGVRDIQLRVKGASPEALDAQVAKAAQACRAAGGRLWVNDFWQAAVRHNTYGVHLGQEDLEAGGGEALRAIALAGLRLGVSTHSYLELARATAVRPSYISLGPVFETSSKKVAFSPRGAVLVRAWRALVDVPLIAIGGISLETAPEVKRFWCFYLLFFFSFHAGTRCYYNPWNVPLIVAVKTWSRRCGGFLARA